MSGRKRDEKKIRKKTSELLNFSFSVSNFQLQKLDQLGPILKISRSKIIRDILHQYLKKHPKILKEKIDSNITANIYYEDYQKLHECKIAGSEIIRLALRDYLEKTNIEEIEKIQTQTCGDKHIRLDEKNGYIFINNTRYRISFQKQLNNPIIIEKGS